MEHSWTCWLVWDMVDLFIWDKTRWTYSTGIGHSEPELGHHLLLGWVMMGIYDLDGTWLISLTWIWHGDLFDWDSTRNTSSTGMRNGKSLLLGWHMVDPLTEMRHIGTCRLELTGVEHWWTSLTGMGDKFQCVPSHLWLEKNIFELVDWDGMWWSTF